ncbi:MAG: hypothetical protein ACK4G3_04660 [bacterium]
MALSPLSAMFFCISSPAGLFFILAIGIPAFLKSLPITFIMFAVFFITNLWLVHRFFETEDWIQAFLLWVTGNAIIYLTRWFLNVIF